MRGRKDREDMVPNTVRAREARRWSEGEEWCVCAQLEELLRIGAHRCGEKVRKADRTRVGRVLEVGVYILPLEEHRFLPQP